jgi:uncharacterized protein YqjF (DUF2071 family)
MIQQKFLTANWQKLIIANYLVDPSILQPYVPAKTTLDSWNGKTFVSLVGFMFADTRVMNIRVPFHITFPEVNLRFYVRYKESGHNKRGVVFIKEVVPKPAITYIANTLFKERYITLPMKSYSTFTDQQQDIGYHWKYKNHWNKLEVKAGAASYPLNTGSEEEFITEHFWGYSSVNKETTGEYQVEHPRWDIYPVQSYTIDCNFDQLYGTPFSILNQQKPCSVFLAEGSAISVYRKRIL